MTERITAVLNRIEAEQQTPALPKDIGAHQLLQMVYRGEVKLTTQQLQAAKECLPYETPKLSAVSVGHMSGDDFASRLDLAIQRSERAKLIEARPNTDQ